MATTRGRASGILGGMGSMVLALMATSGAVAPVRPPFDVRGVIVTPHVRATSMRFRRDPGPADGALIRVVLQRPPGSPPWCRRDVRFDGRTGRELVEDGVWAWCDFPGDEMGAADPLAAGELTVLTFNTRASGHGMGATVRLGLDGWPEFRDISLQAPSVHIAAATFFGEKSSASTERALLHIANTGPDPISVVRVRFHQPADRRRFWAISDHAISPTVRFYPARGRIAARDTGIVEAACRLERTYVLVAVDVRAGRGPVRTLYAHLRVKPEAFDISAGWIDGGTTRDGRRPPAHEEYLKTLKGLHVNTAHFTEIPGYSDQTGPGSLYDRYPLKRFGMLQPIERYDRDATLPFIHAVEFLGEPQYGGGRPVAPQDVWKQLHPYSATRLPTTVTLSEEALWRYYAGLSDFPHFDAYRVNAPAADAWHLYDRWNGTRIRWGAPLETIGDMCRSLREMARPAPMAYWSQGPHDWDSYGGRKRTTPTCDEIRLQAYHALSSRITSLYWFNLSLKSLLLYPDTMVELRRTGREMRMLERFYLEGCAYRYRQMAEDGQPAWDLASIAAPTAAVLFALDLRYQPDPVERVFVFGPPRHAAFEFTLPAFLRRPADVFRVDADGVHSVDFETTLDGVRITDRTHKVAVYVAARSRALRREIEARRQQLVEAECALGFDPVGNAGDLAALRAIQGLR